MAQKKSITRKQTNKTPKTTLSTPETIRREIDDIYECHLKDKYTLSSKESNDMDILEPDIEVTEDADSFYVKAELPGIDAKDIDISLSTDGYLIIAGEKRRVNQHNEKGCWFSECSYGSVNRTIPLPREINPENVSAEFKNGVLALKIQKREEAKEKIKKIKLKSENY